MYNPKHFAQSDHQHIVATLRQLAVAELITYGSEGIEASLIPVLLNDDATLLTAHLARGNRQWKHADTNVPVLITWRGPDAYISPSFYPSKQETGKVVPTWNYITVQARGTLIVHDDPVWVEQLVRSLTATHEAEFPTPWSIDDAPRDYIDSMLKAIVGIEVQITSIEAKWKMSQNKTEEDVNGVITSLQQRDARDAYQVAAAVAAAQHQAQQQ
jgi:transcriptional regulator